MAKLQKTLKQQRRRSVQARPQVAKLTAAEIRSLNNSAQGSKQDSLISKESPHRNSNNTPPATPDNQAASTAHQTQLARRSTIDLPTPPRSPSKQPQHARRSSVTIGQGHVHAPKPNGASQADFIIGQAISRPASASSYRGVPTYRGPEVTRTRSFNMTQRPDQHVVSNPLSNFSRPRQSLINASPDNCKHDYREVDAYQAQNIRNRQRQSGDSAHVSTKSARSPPRAIVSPASSENGGQRDTETFPTLEENTPPNDVPEQDKTQTPSVDELNHRKKVEATKEKRKIAGFPKGEGRASLFKSRRRTPSFTKGPDVIDFSPPKTDLAEPVDNPTADSRTESKQEERPNEDFQPHPAIRPLSGNIPTSDVKGKSRETSSAPVYSMCACCGKLKRPQGYSSELSPVLENENLRSNFSFEIKRNNPITARSLSSSTRGKSIHIISMAVGEHEIRQSAIEPQPMIRTNDGQLVAPSVPVPDSQRARLSVPTSVRRFGSLYGLRINDSITESEENSVRSSDAQTTPRSSTSGETRETPPVFSIHDAVTSPRMTPQKAVTFAADKFSLDSAEQEPAERRRSGRGYANKTPYSTEHDAPSLGSRTGTKDFATDENTRIKSKTTTTTAQYTNHSAEPPQPASGAPSTLSSFRLPQPSLGPRFARSNATLNDWVIPKGGSTVDLTEGLVKVSEEEANGDDGDNLARGFAQSRRIDDTRQSREKWAAEVMVV